MQRPLFLLFLLVLISACNHQLPEDSTSLHVLPEAPYHAPYDRSALQNLKWLAGAWKSAEKGPDLTFLFHTDQMLEVMQSENGNLKASLYFSWKDGHYYYGQNRQWMVSWISEKNIRFDPVVPGLKPMTWSRVHENEWHLLKHTDSGDQIIVMERTEEVPS